MTQPLPCSTERDDEPGVEERTELGAESSTSEDPDTKRDAPRESQDSVGQENPVLPRGSSSLSPDEVVAGTSAVPPLVDNRAHIQLLRRVAKTWASKQKRCGSRNALW